MRIAIDASRAGTGERTGTENYSHQMIRAILRVPGSERHKWIIYTRPGQGREWIRPGAEVREINRRYLWTQGELALQTWLDKPDWLWVPAHTLPVLGWPGCRMLVTIHGIEYEWLPQFENRLQRWYLPLSTIFAVKRADRVVAVSEFTKSELVQRLGGDPKKITVIYEGAGAGVMLGNSKAQSGLLRKYGLNPGQYYLFVGTIQPRKNLTRLIEAYAGTDRKWRLVVAGKRGWSDEEVMSAPGRFGVEGDVVFTGYVSDNDRQILLTNAGAYVQPSIVEGFGLPVVEAFAAGIPVVSSWGGALREVVGDAGLLFDPYDTDQMKTSLKMVQRDKKLREELTEKGRRQKEIFDWDKAAKRVLELIETYSY